jgi:hypothetical protein
MTDGSLDDVQPPSRLGKQMAELSKAMSTDSSMQPSKEFMARVEREFDKQFPKGRATPVTRLLVAEKQNR